MAEMMGIYKCEICGNIVEVVHEGKAPLVCCAEEMTLMEEQTAEMSVEKHVPVIEEIDGGYKVTVGTTLHPMEEEHYIEWIELLAEDTAYRKFLNPGDEPVATFMIEEDDVSAREYCNVHGLWKGEKQ